MQMLSEHEKKLFMNKKNSAKVTYTTAEPGNKNNRKMMSQNSTLPRSDTYLLKQFLKEMMSVCQYESFIQRAK